MRHQQPLQVASGNKQYAIKHHEGVFKQNESCGIIHDLLITNCTRKYIAVALIGKIPIYGLMYAFYCQWLFFRGLGK